MSDVSRDEHQGIAQLVSYATEKGGAQVLLHSKGVTVSLSHEGLNKAERKLANRGIAHAA